MGWTLVCAAKWGYCIRYRRSWVRIRVTPDNLLGSHLNEFLYIYIYIYNWSFQFEKTHNINTGIDVIRCVRLCYLVTPNSQRKSFRFNRTVICKCLCQLQKTAYHKDWKQYCWKVWLIMPTASIFHVKPFMSTLGECISIIIICAMHLQNNFTTFAVVVKAE